MLSDREVPVSWRPVRQSGSTVVLVLSGCRKLCRCGGWKVVILPGLLEKMHRLERERDAQHPP